MSTLQRHENCIPTGRRGAVTGPQVPLAKRAGLVICLAWIAGWAVILPGPLRGQESCDSGPGTWVEIESQTASVSRAKFGYTTGCSETLYLTEVFHVADTYTMAVSGGNTYVYSTDTTQRYWYTEENRRNAWPAEPCVWNALDDRLCTGQASYNLEPDDGTDCSTTTVQPGCFAWNNPTCANTVTAGLNSRAADPVLVTCTDDYERNEFHENISDSDVTVIRDLTEEWTLTNPYTDAMLRGDILYSLPDYPGYWLPWADTAFYSLGEGHYCGEGQKMKYRFHFESQATITYRLTWSEVTHQPDGSTSRKHLEESVPGTGGRVYSTEHEILPPEWKDYNYPGPAMAYVTVEEVAIRVDPMSAGGDGRSGNPGGGGVGSPSGPGSGGAPDGPVFCFAADCSYGGSRQPQDGVLLRISLGTASYGGSVGALIVSASEPSPDLARPVLLQFGSLRAEVDVVTQNGELRQVKGPQALADIVAINDYKYEIRFYYPSQVGAKTGDLYAILDPDHPYVRWTIENPDASPTAYNRLRVTEARDGINRDNDYAYDAGTQTWVLTRPGNTGLDQTVFVENAGAGTREYITTVQPPGGGTVLRVSKKYQQFSWGEALIEQTIGDGANKQTTTLTYYTTGYTAQQVSGIKRPLQQVLRPDGSWERYAYDSSLRRMWVRSSFGNEPPTDSSYCRATWYSYGPVHVDDDGALEPSTPRLEINYLLGYEIGRTYRVLVADATCLISERRVYQCQTAAADVTAADNLVTVTKYYLTGDFAGRPKCVNHPDGTRTAYLYGRSGSDTSAVETRVVLVGQPDGANDTNILTGTVTTTVIGHVGQLVSRTIQDKVSLTVLSQETYSYADELKRSYTVTTLDGSSKTVQYACCGLESVIDPDGVLHQYVYDEAGRPLGSTDVTHGLTTTNVLDAAGNVLASVRNAGGSLVWLDRRAYDSAGRVTLQTNALGGVTTYTETISQWQKTRTTRYPDTGYRVELYNRDGSLAKVTGTAVQPVSYWYGVGFDIGGTWSERTTEYKLDAYGAVTDEYTLTYQDLLGRSYETVYADGAYRQSWYNNLGQLWKSTDPDYVATLYQYNGKGELEYSVVDLDRDGVVDWSGTDRITQTLRDVTTYAGSPANRTRTYVHTTDGSSATALVSMTQTSTDGLQSWQTSYKDQSTPVTTASVRTVPDANGHYTVTVTYPDGSSQVSAYTYGWLTSVTRRDAGGAQVSQTTYEYDAHGRTWKVTDARNGTTTYTYNNADQVVTVTAPDLGTGEAAQVTTTFYDTLGRVTGTQYPDGTTSTNQYYLTGLLRKTWGSRAYPVEYTYDPQGRMRTMKTWQNFSGNAGAATTRWNYDYQRGWLASKDYPDPGTGDPPSSEGSTGPVYTYTPAGRLRTRVWQRWVTTTYACNNAGDVQSVTYSGGVPTPTTTYTYDRRGRRAAALRNGITTTWTYNDANQPLTESHAGGTLAGLSMSWTHDNALRRSLVAAQNGGTPLQAATYGYDGAGRLQSVTDGAATVTYTYQPDSSLVNTLTFKENTTARLATTRNYDKLNRLLSISSVPSVASAVSFAYQYNAANQRTRATLGDGSYWVYQYDPLGQVISGRRCWSDGTEVAGQQFDYRFDDIGNRDTSGGRASAESDYTANRRNQYTTRTVPPYVDVMGLANPTADVTVNGAVASRKGEYFHYALNVPNTTAQYPTLTVTSLYGAQQSTAGETFVPATPETFGYDNDGNLTSDGRWSYTWDGENRLVQMVARTSVGPQQLIKFEYDHQGRRIRKQVWNNTGGTGSPAVDLRFLYDGWNLIAILDPQSALLESFVWGNDLSGTVDGAGGVGGLLKVTCYGATPTNAFVAYDGNGNVVALVKAADGTYCARYEYGPCGEVIRATGPLAKANPFRFSTKYQDDESGLLYYGYRYYNPSTGRWLSRDPAGQLGGANLYLFARNNALSIYDILGLWNSDVHQGRTIQWAGQVGVDQEHSIMIGVYDDGIDSDYSTYNFDDWNWGWHFNRSRSGDSRMMHRDAELQKAKERCTNPTDDAHFASEYLGRALHPLQDWVAHGDFNRKIEEPSLTGFHWWERRYYWHNWDALYHTAGLYGPGDPDNPEMDANGPDGRATIDTLQTGTLISNGDQAYWTGFHGGHQRINLTERLTKGLLTDFQAYVRAHGKPCGECWKAFIGRN